MEILIALIMMILIIMMKMNLPMVMNTEELGALQDYLTTIITNQTIITKNNYIEYTSRGDIYKNLSPTKCLDMIRPYLRDLINDYKHKAELSNGSERGE